MASLLGRPMLQFGLENEQNKCGLEGQQTVSSPGGEEQKRDPKPSLNQWCGSQTLPHFTEFCNRGCPSTTVNVNERWLGRRAVGSKLQQRSPSVAQRVSKVDVTRG